MDRQRLQVNAILLCAALKVFGSDPSVKVVWDVDQAPLRTRGVVGRVDLSTLRREAFRLLVAGRYRVGSFVAYNSEADRFRASGQDRTDCSYDSWRAALDLKGFDTDTFKCPVFFQALKLGHNIVFRNVEADCRTIATLVHGGTDPLRVDINGEAVEILDVIIAPNIRGTPNARVTFGPVLFYARTSGEVTTGRARALATYLHNLTNASDITVVLRNDQWFARDCEFPVAFMFGRRFPGIPSNREYLNGREATCSALKSWPIQCY